MSAAARAFWIAAPGQGEIRTAPLPPPGPGDVLVHAAASGISRGTESLVFRGAVPASQHGVMRCPFQEGGFPAPVKYGYAVAGRTEEGARVFCLHPHQDRFVLPRDAAVPRLSPCIFQNTPVTMLPMKITTLRMCSDLSTKYVISLPRV